MTFLPEESIQELQTLGFSNLEASIYLFLLLESPATGYKIAQALGKPVANTYKGISALQLKGAVLVEEGETRLCRAVPPDEMMGQMERDFQSRRKQVSLALAHLKSQPEDARVYTLSTWEQVMERTRQMIQSSRQVVLLSAFPQPLSEIQADLEQAVERGVGVLLKAYLPIEIKGARIALSNESGLLLDHLPIQELSVVVDAEQYLLAMLDRNSRNVMQAIWSNSLLLSFSHYNSLYNEWELTALIRQIRADSTSETLKGSLQRAYPLLQTPGYHKLIQSFQRKENP